MWDMKDLGTLIAEARRKRGIRTQRELALAIDRDPAWLSRLERGEIKETPSPEVMHALADVLRVPEARLLEAAGYRVAEADPDAGITLGARVTRAEIVRLLADAPDEVVTALAGSMRSLLPVLAGGATAAPALVPAPPRSGGKRAGAAVPGDRDGDPVMDGERCGGGARRIVPGVDSGGATDRRVTPHRNAR